ncbi:MAG: glucose-6-phosphate isomerase family protein [Phycisphaerae bacterium]|nr:glucose-6-phosphate isomerase family protein [Phycisphaerae bacterium]
MKPEEINNLLMPFSVELNLETGEMLNPKNHIVRKASDMKGYYADSDALNNLIEKKNDPLHYEVFEVPVPAESGQLMYCISKLQPGKIGDEFFMTKGHYHSIAETAELYICLRGKGYMAMKTSAGKWNAQKMTRGKMVYVPPCWAHRSINTGKEPLISFCVYRGDAGHNYGDIEQEGFPKRIFERGGKVVIE